MEVNCEVEGGRGSNELGVRRRVCENYWRNCREGRMGQELRKGRGGCKKGEERKRRIRQGFKSFIESAAELKLLNLARLSN